MFTRYEIRTMSLAKKDRLLLTWPQIGEAIGHSPVYTAFLVDGYGQATPAEAEGLSGVMEMPPIAEEALLKAPHRTPAQSWPPTDPFI